MLGALLAVGMPEQVSLRWLTERLQERSFGAYLFLLGIIGMLPFASIPAGILIAILVGQIIAGKTNPILPSFIADRKFRSSRIVGPMRRVIAAVRGLETVVTPRLQWVFHARRLAGPVAFVLALTLLIPIPFSNVVPALALALTALAYIERDGLLFVLSLAGGITSVVVLVELIWRIV